MWMADHHAQNLLLAQRVAVKDQVLDHARGRPLGLLAHHMEHRIGDVGRCALSAALRGKRTHQLSIHIAPELAGVESDGDVDPLMVPNFLSPVGAVVQSFVIELVAEEELVAVEHVEEDGGEDGHLLVDEGNRPSRGEDVEVLLPAIPRSVQPHPQRQTELASEVEVGRDSEVAGRVGDEGAPQDVSRGSETQEAG